MRTLTGLIFLVVVSTTQGQHLYPGNGSDCDIRVSINDVFSSSTNGKHVISTGDLVTLRFLSPGGTLIGEGFLAALQYLPTGSLLPIPVPGLGNLYIDLAPGVATMVLFNGLPGTPQLYPPVLNSRVDFIIPPVFFGLGMSLYSTCISFDPSLPGGSSTFGLADTEELELQ